ncbi:MAG: hypothetical protein CMA07_06635 [Euryarchaeota archaeon]|nr:hypothetical protein [Euryarchaeota archaeon]
MSKFERNFWDGMTLIFVCFLCFVSFKTSADNEISLEQSGTNFSLGIEQVGSHNVIQMLSSDSYNTTTYSGFLFIQYNEDTSSDNKITIDEVTGTGNGVKICQGCAFDYPESYTNHDYWYDNWEGGGHTVDLTMYGDNNGVSVQQTNQGSSDGHSVDLHLAGDDNEVTTIQQHDGAKSIYLTIYNDENDVFIRQKGSGSTHNANITLDGTYGTDLTLKQFNSTASYTLQQNCLTVGGCSVTITQQ